MPLSEYSRPTDPGGAAVRKGFRQLLGRLLDKGPGEEQAPPVPDLRSVSGTLLDQVARPPDWRALAGPLRSALGDWLTGDRGGRRVRVVIGPPGSGAAEAVTAWAEAEGAVVVEEPDAACVTEGGERWLADLPEAPLVALPRLERSFLRRHDGLQAARRLVARLGQRAGRAVVGCDAWAWAYLSLAAGADALGAPLTLAACDAAGFGRWFSETARAGGPPVEFRQAKTGALVLAAEPADADWKPTPFLCELAAASRGIPGVGWHIWRHALRAAADESLAREDVASAPAGRTLWLESWARLELPRVPPGLGPDATLALHALLLHGGLPEAQLASVVPGSGSGITAALLRLESAGLIEEREGRWQVAPIAYPAVREHLRGEDFLVDAF